MKAVCRNLVDHTRLEFWEVGENDERPQNFVCFAPEEAEDPGDLDVVGESSSINPAKVAARKAIEVARAQKKKEKSDLLEKMKGNSALTKADQDAAIRVMFLELFGGD